MATNDIGRVTPIWRGFYSAAATYELNDIVIDTAGSVWWHKSEELTTGVIPEVGEIWDAVIDMSVFSGLIQAAITTAQTALAAAQEAVAEVTADTERAETAADNAENSAAAASESAAGVGALAQAAERSAEAAAGSATGAAGSAAAAAGSKSDAEAYAVGTRGGEDVETTDPTYHNNAKYYAEQAASEAEAAAQSAEDAQDVLDSIPEDYSELSADVGDLKTQLKDEQIIKLGRDEISAESSDNLIDPVVFMGADGISVDDNGYYVGTALSFRNNFGSDAGGIAGLTFDANTQYSFSALVYSGEGVSDSGGLRFRFDYTDDTVTNITVPINTNTPVVVSGTSMNGKTIAAFSILYSNGPSIVWHVKDLILVKSATVPGEFVPHLIPVDSVARKLGTEAKTLAEEISGDIYFNGAYHWDSIATSDYPTGWRTGYYNTSTGLYASSSNYLCTYKGFSFGINIITITATAPDGYGIRIYEYDKDNALQQYWGITNPAQGDITKTITINPNPAMVYKFALGKFTTASDYNNSEFLANVTLTAKGLKLYDKKDKTGEFEFFTVNVDRPMAFSGEEISNTIETVECVLRLPNTYTPDGVPTRLILCCHGSSGFVRASSNTWYNANWKDFMDSLLAAGYAVFDSNVLANSYGDSIMGKAYGSPLYVNVLKKAYDYIYANYNVYREIFAHGTSMGGVGASAFTNAYPDLVLAQSSFAGRDLTQYLYGILTGDIDSDDVDFANAYGYSTFADLSSDKFSHCEGNCPSLSLVKITNGAIAMPPDRDTDYTNWLTYYSAVQGQNRDSAIPDFIGKRNVPYKSWNCWTDDIGKTKAELILQKAFTKGNSAPYLCVIYDSVPAGIDAHSAMSYGLVNDMRDQLISWFKRWE